MKWKGTCLSTSNQCCHFSCQPTPSKLTTMNCGGFSPSLSLVGTKPDGIATPSCTGPSPAWVAVGLADVEALAEVEASGLGAGGSEDSGLDSGPAVTKLVTVWSPAEVALLQALSRRANAPVTATMVLRRPDRP